MSERSATLRRMASVLERRREQLARQAVLEMGKPIIQALAEIDKCATTCIWFAENGPRLLADESTSGDRSAQESYVKFEPLGTVLAIMPWNFPYWQLFRAAAPRSWQATRWCSSTLFVNVKTVWIGGSEKGRPHGAGVE